MNQLVKIMAVALLVAVPAVAVVQVWTNGDQSQDATVWRATLESPMFEIRSLSAEPGKIQLRLVGGYYPKGEMEIVRVAWAGQAHTFRVEYRAKGSNDVQSCLLDIEQAGFVSFAKEQAQKACPDVKVGEHPTVSWVNDGISLVMTPIPANVSLKQ